MSKLKNDEKNKRSAGRKRQIFILLIGVGTPIIIAFGVFFLRGTTLFNQADFAYTTRCGIQLYDLDTEQVVGVFPQTCTVVHNYDFSPDGKQVVYTNDSSQVIIGDIKSGQQVALPIEDISALAWSPDGEKIAMWVYQGLPSGETLVVYDVETGDIRDYGTYSVRFTSLSWSPNSNELLFTLDHSTDMELGHFNITTGELTQLTDDEHNNRYPVWSGNQAIFSRLDAESVRDSLWRINIATGEQEKLIDARTIIASVSPSGAYIVYQQTNSDGYPAVYVMPLDTLQSQQITPHEPEPYLPVWLPTADYGVEGN